MRVILLATALFLSTLAQASETVTADETIKTKFYDTMLTKHGFTKAELDDWFRGVEVDERIIESMSKPAEKVLTWPEYQAIFLRKDRIEQGIEFWNTHKDTLRRANETYGIPIEIIVGLIGVETRYGRIMGSYDVFRSLYTLSFYYPRRAKFFTGELQAFLVLARDQGWTKDTIKGSYAGAMGYGQFMPTSYQAYAVDFDADGKIELIDNVIDAIGSVANYIHRHGWEKDAPIVKQLDVQATIAEPLLSKGIRPDRPLLELSEAGVALPEGYSKNGKGTLFKLTADEDQYWLGYKNFYVLSRYNPRIFYTKAVLELSDAIRDAYNDLPKES